LNKVSVVLIVRNEAGRIERTLKSVQWADEIVIIDSFSTDDTINICKKYTDKIYQYKWEGFSKQRRKSIEHASNQWVLSIDADEVVSEELKHEIRDTISQKDSKAGYMIPRKSWYIDRWIENSGWYPDFQLRLFQKQKAYIEDREVHEGFSVTGETAKLNSVLYHYSYDSIEHHISKINTYTTLDISAKLKKLKGRPVRWYHLLLSPLSTFLRMFLVLKGYRDGLPGFILAVNSAAYALLLYTKVWEKQNISNKS
jgi:glycosyltransferase involved in cell wall biosynthesis